MYVSCQSSYDSLRDSVSEPIDIKSKDDFFIGSACLPKVKTKGGKNIGRNLHDYLFKRNSSLE